MVLNFCSTAERWWSLACEKKGFLRGLTFDMSGSHKWAKPACDCPFDGRVRRLAEQLQLRAPPE